MGSAGSCYAVSFYCETSSNNGLPSPAFVTPGILVRVSCTRELQPSQTMPLTWHTKYEEQRGVETARSKRARTRRRRGCEPGWCLLGHYFCRPTIELFNSLALISTSMPSPPSAQPPVAPLASTTAACFAPRQLPGTVPRQLPAAKLGREASSLRLLSAAQPASAAGRKRATLASTARRAEAEAAAADMVRMACIRRGVTMEAIGREFTVTEHCRASGSAGCPATALFQQCVQPIHT